MSKSVQKLRVLFLLATTILLLAFVIPAFGTGMTQAAYQKLPASNTHLVATDNQTVIESNEYPARSTAGTGEATSIGQEAVPEIATVTNGLAQRFIFNLPGGYVVAGVAMRNRGYGNISICNISSGSTIEKAYLYWDILDNSEKPEFKMGTFNGTSIEGILIGSGADPCWDPTMNFAYRADVTDNVTGNGTYALTDFASGRQDGCDPWICPQDLPLLEGASLVIIYRNPALPVQNIVIYDGAETLECNSYTISITDFTAPSPLGSASITYLGADGQEGGWFTDAPECTYFNGVQIADRDWEGSDPQAGPSYSYGNLWDTNTYDVTSLVKPGDTYATATVRSYPGDQGYCDCLVWVAAVFSVSKKADAYGLWRFAVITDPHIGWGIPDYGNEGYSDTSGSGQEYFLTERLRNTVQWINDHAIDDKIKFVVVDGDISDTAEYAEFKKAKDILAELNIPYIPVIGNHDIWPYTMKINADPDHRNTRTVKLGMVSEPPSGDEYFDEAFWKVNSCQWLQMQNNQGYPYLQNYSLNYNGVQLVALDFASRERSGNKKAFQVGANYGVNYEPTMKWFEQEIAEHHGENIVVLTHHPLMYIDGFAPIDLETTLADILSLMLANNCDCRFFNFAGHTHRNYEAVNPAWVIIPGDVQYEVAETQAVSQIPFPTRPPSGEFVRIATVIGDSISYERLERTAPPAINPFFTVNHEDLAIGQKITFEAVVRGQETNIHSYYWDFGDGQQVTTSNPKFRNKTYDTPGEKLVTLIVTDDNGNSEGISWNLNIKAKAKQLYKVILPVSDLVPVLNGEHMDLTQEEYAQNTASWAVIKKTSVLGKPIAGLVIHFEEATVNVDLSGLLADTDLEKRKSVIHMDSWPETIEESKDLYIPSTGVGSVYVCRNATSLEEVTPLCENITVLDIGETENSMTLTTEDYYGPEYYLVSAIQSGGGGEFGPLEKSIKNLNDYIQSLPDEAFRNNPEQRKNAFENKLNEAWTQIDNGEYQKAIDTLQKHIRANADGDKKAEDWILTPIAQREICTMVDQLVTYLNSL